MNSDRSADISFVEKIPMPNSETRVTASALNRHGAENNFFSSPNNGCASVNISLSFSHLYFVFATGKGGSGEGAGNKR